MQSNFQIKLTAVTPHFYLHVVFEYCPWHRKNDTPDLLEQENKTVFFSNLYMRPWNKMKPFCSCFLGFRQISVPLEQSLLIINIQSAIPCMCVLVSSQQQAGEKMASIYPPWLPTKHLERDIITLAKHQNVVADSAITNYQFTPEYFMVIALCY